MDERGEGGERELIAYRLISTLIINVRNYKNKACTTSCDRHLSLNDNLYQTDPDTLINPNKAS